MGKFFLNHMLGFMIAAWVILLVAFHFFMSWFVYEHDATITEFAALMAVIVLVGWWADRRLRASRQAPRRQ